MLLGKKKDIRAKLRFCESRWLSKWVFIIMKMLEESAIDTDFFVMEKKWNLPSGPFGGGRDVGVVDTLGKLISCAQSWRDWGSCAKLVELRRFLAPLCYINVPAFLSCSHPRIPLSLAFPSSHFVCRWYNCIAITSKVPVVHKGNLKTTTEENLGNSEVYEN